MLINNLAYNYIIMLTTIIITKVWNILLQYYKYIFNFKIIINKIIHIVIIKKVKFFVHLIIFLKI